MHLTRLVDRHTMSHALAAKDDWTCREWWICYDLGTSLKFHMTWKLVERVGTGNCCWSNCFEGHLAQEIPYAICYMQTLCDPEAKGNENSISSFLHTWRGSQSFKTTLLQIAHFVSTWYHSKFIHNSLDIPKCPVYQFDMAIRGCKVYLTARSRGVHPQMHILWLTIQSLQ